MKFFTYNFLNNKKIKVNRLKISAVIPFFILLCTVQLVRAGETQINVHELLKTGQILSLEKIRIFAKTYVAGEILETELERKHGIYIYEVEILDDNSQVWELKLDAKTGKLIKMEQDD